jgi:phage terminase large subunit-like protein
MARARVQPILVGDLPVRPSVLVSRFFERHLRHQKDRWAGRPFILEPWQLKDFIEPVYDTLLPNGLRRIHEAMLGVGRKNGKTHLGAGLGAHGTFADGHYTRDPNGWVWTPTYGAEVYNVAGSKDQAKVLFNIARGFVEADPWLRQMAVTYKDAIEVPETGAVWRVLAADSRLAHGLNPSIAIIDEIWVHKNPELYEAFASAMAARQQPLLMIITTAGFDQRTIAYKLYKRGKRARSPGFYFKWYEARAGCRLDDWKAIKVANPSTVVTIPYLKKELKRARDLGLEYSYRRLHGNQWTSTKEMAIPIELWDRGRKRALVPPKSEVIVGVDSAPQRDSTGIVIDRRDAKGVHHWRHTKMEVDPETGYLDFAMLEDLIREIDRTYAVRAFHVDRYNMIRSMLMLQEEGLPIQEFPQTDQRMVPASMNLYELLIQDRLHHGGDPDLREQIQAASKQVTERGWRLKKKGSTGAIDGLVAGAMAAYEWERPPDPEPEKHEPSLYVFATDEESS